MSERAVFECGICRYLYDEGAHKPLTLTCGHVFCEDCLTRMSRTEDLKCPIHKGKILTPVKDLPCCLNILNNLPTLRQKDFYCPQHSKKRVKYRCKVHQKFLCSDCIIEHTGSGHSVEHFSASSQTVRTQSEELRRVVNKRTTVLLEAKKAIEGDERKLVSNYENQVMKINAVYDNAMNALKAKRNEFLNTLKTAFHSQSKQLEQARIQVQRMADSSSILVSKLNKLTLDLGFEELLQGIEDVHTETKRFEDWKPVDLHLSLFDDGVKVTDTSQIIKSKISDCKGNESRELVRVPTRAFGLEARPGAFWICKECSLPNEPDAQTCIHCKPENPDFTKSLGAYGHSPKCGPAKDESHPFSNRPSRSFKPEKDPLEVSLKTSLHSQAKIIANKALVRSPPDVIPLTRRQANQRTRKHSRQRSVHRPNNSF